jgi:hypothetical protein
LVDYVVGRGFSHDDRSERRKTALAAEVEVILGGFRLKFSFPSEPFFPLW